MIRRFLILPLCLILGACATPAPPDTSAGGPGVLLAALLVETERVEPARVAAAAAEMAALEAALMSPGRSEIAPQEVEPHGPALSPAPSLQGAQSAMSAVHLASYRVRAHAEAGWTELSERHPALAGLSPRLASADLGERGVFLRLKAGPFDSPSQAAEVCAALAEAGDWCQPTDFTGESL